MFLVRKVLLVLSVMLLAGCNFTTSPFQNVQAPTQPPLAMESSPTQAMSSSPTDTPSADQPPTQTPLPTVENSPVPVVATEPLLPTATATSIPTETSVPVLPTSTFDSSSATLSSELGSLGSLGDMSQYLHPAGTPLSNWQNVPIMPQASAGQEYNGNVYSYLATATLDQARQYYINQTNVLGFISAPTTGTSGSGSLASHDVTFISFNLSIVLTSFDNDTSHVIVIISITPM